LKNNVLLLGGSGTLGSSIIKSKLFKKIKFPSRKELNILNQQKLEKYFLKHSINLIIHCAALARVRACQSNKKKAFKINVQGTSNIVKTILKINKNYKKNIKLIFISSDAVYKSNSGGYRETDKLLAYNFYGITKIKGEKIVKKLKNYIIIRTRFFDKRNIRFKYYADNIFTSSLEVEKLVKYIFKLIKKKFKGTINVGRNKISDFKLYKRFKKTIKSCDKIKIIKKLNLIIATDASLNLSKMKKILC
jgi:dTDP-4-dehydrorhamnose reductase